MSFDDDKSDMVGAAAPSVGVNKICSDKFVGKHVIYQPNPQPVQSRSDLLLGIVSGSICQVR